MFALDHLKRTLAFGRHMPAHKVARRLELTVRRKLRDRWLTHAVLPAADLPPRSFPLPLSLFMPLRTEPIFDEACRRITLLGHSVVLDGPDRIDWKTPGAAPDNQLWRMKLHDMQYLEQLPDRLFATLVGDWIVRNAPTDRGAWKDSWNSYTVSIRAVVWMQEIARRGNRLEETLVSRMEASLAQHIRFLVHNIETDIGGNHLIKNIKALLWASAFFAGPEATRWRDLALDLLRAELPVQILGDGVHFERSPSYHCRVFADLLECRHVLAKDPFGGTLDDALHRMAQAAADLAHPDGAVVQFNDSGLTMALPPRACLHAYSRLFGSRPQPRRIFAFPDAGIYGLRAGASYFAVDCGRIAPDDLPAHGHGDVLSFEWSVRGQRVIVDQGVFQYSAGPRRQFARSAANHNTLSFAGTDQADFFGAFRCGRRPNVEIRAWEPREDGFTLEGAHDGFRHLPGAPIHVRRFEASTGEIVIHDRIEGDPSAQASVGFLLHPSAHAEVTNQQVLIRCRAGDIHLASTQPMAIEHAVWWPDLGHEQRTMRLRIPVAPGNRELRTVLRVAPACGAMT